MYDVPAVRPVTVHAVDDVVHVAPPGDAVTVYETIGCPPSSTGADHDTVAACCSPTAETPTGGVGASAPTSIR